MRNLTRNEYIAVFVGLIIVGFFFLFWSFFGSVSSGNEEAPNVPIDISALLSSGETGLVTRDIVEGRGALIEPGLVAVVHYTGVFPDGTPFDSSRSRGEPFRFVVGKGEVIPGWDQGILGMRVGGKRILVIPPALAYGEEAVGPIPANSTLVFEIELIAVESR